MLTEEDLREKAQKRVKGKTTLYVTAVVFSCVSLVLLMLSFYLTSVGFWLRLPIPVFLMVLGIMYISTYGYSMSTDRSVNWEAEEVEKEMNRLRKSVQAGDFEDAEAPDPAGLELRELERQKEKQAWRDDLI